MGFLRSHGLIQAGSRDESGKGLSCVAGMLTIPNSAWKPFPGRELGYELHLLCTNGLRKARAVVNCT
jgi:hypothetical protein